METQEEIIFEDPKPLTVSAVRSLLVEAGDFDTDDGEGGWYAADLGDLAIDLGVETADIRQVCELPGSGLSIDESTRTVEYHPAPGDIL